MLQGAPIPRVVADAAFTHNPHIKGTAATARIGRFMVGRSWSRFGWVLAAAGWLAAMAMPAASRPPHAYGKDLVAQYRLPAHTIARYAALAAGTAAAAGPSRGDSMFADQAPWVGPAQRAGVGNNPYVLVLTVSGAAKAAGQVHSKWQAGWEVHESTTASRELVMLVSGLAREGLAAGERVNLTAYSAPVSFRGERRVAPMLGVVQTRNIDIDEVFVQVWSGTAPMAWSDTGLSPRVLLALLASGLLLYWGAGRWPRRAPSQAEDFAYSLPDTSSRFADSGSGNTASAERPRLSREVPVVVDPGHKARVIDTLAQLLSGGCVVETVFDEERMQNRRRANK